MGADHRRFGKYTYTYETGHFGDICVVGFSPRAASLSIYSGMYAEEAAPHLKSLGKHKVSKSCIYINKLEDIDMAAFEKLIEAGVARMKMRAKEKGWPISGRAAEAAAATSARMLEVRYVSEHSLRGERAPRLLRYLLGHGADEFSIAVMTLQDTPAPFAAAFEDELGPFERPVASRRVPTTAAAGELTRAVRLWAFNEALLARLLSFMDTGLLHWPAGPDGWFEDLTIYRRGELALGLVSHEQEGVLRLTHQEHADIAALDIPSEPSAKWIDY